MLAGIPNVPHEVGAGGAVQRTITRKALASGASRRTSALRPSRTGNWASSWACWTWNGRSSSAAPLCRRIWDLGAKLERALANFMLDLHTSEHGYTEVLTALHGEFSVNVSARGSCRSSPANCFKIHVITICG